MQQIIQNVGKFLFPAFLLIVGLFTVIFGAAKDQPTLFIISGVAVVLIGVVSLLFALKKITQQLQIILSIALIVIAAVLAYNDYRSVKNDIDFVVQKKKIYSEVIQNMKDIREAQVAYNKSYGAYAPNFDSLENFIKNGRIALIEAYGEVPDTLSESEALELGIITRDTVMVPVIESIFLNPEAQAERKFRFNLDSLRFAPVSGAEFIMRTGNIDRNGIKTSVFLLEDSKPFDPSEPLKVGSLTEASTSGNWSGE